MWTNPSWTNAIIAFVCINPYSKSYIFLSFQSCHNAKYGMILWHRKIVSLYVTSKMLDMHDFDHVLARYYSHSRKKCMIMKTLNSCPIKHTICLLNRHTSVNNLDVTSHSQAHFSHHRLHRLWHPKIIRGIPQSIPPQTISPPSL